MLITFEAFTLLVLLYLLIACAFAASLRGYLIGSATTMRSSQAIVITLAAYGLLWPLVVAVPGPWFEFVANLERRR